MDDVNTENHRAIVENLEGLNSDDDWVSVKAIIQILHLVMKKCIWHVCGIMFLSHRKKVRNFSKIYEFLSLRL